MIVLSNMDVKMFHNRYRLYTTYLLTYLLNLAAFNTTRSSVIKLVML